MADHGSTRRLIGALAGVLFALACDLAAAASAVTGMRVTREPGHTRLVFDLSEPAHHQLSGAESPPRLILDLGNTRLQGSVQSQGLAGTPVQRIRSGMLNAADLRIVIDVGAAVDAKSILLPPGEGQGSRLVLDIYPRGGQAVAKITPPASAPIPAAAPSPAAPAPDPAPAVVAATPAAPEATPREAPQESLPALATPVPAKGGRGRDILIAIDAGHGGDDPGALGPRRVREKDVVLAIARELESRVNQQPGYRAMLVRKGDYFIPLKKRRDIARAAGADLFVSVHADAFTHSRARGASVYALSPRGATSVSAAFLAERENGADLIGGVNLGEKDDVLASVLTDLSMTATMDASIGAGGRVLGSMGRVAHLHKRQVEQAGFAVLKSPDMPSILVETGFISNPAEAERLGTRSYQKAMARAIFEGLGNYFLSAPPPDSLVAMRVRGGERPSEYVIARGDTLSGIAERYRVSVSDIVRTNRLGGAGGIQAGQRILIPQS